MDFSPVIKSSDLASTIGKLLPSQQEFIYASERFSAIAGGFGSGKTRSICLKALVLSAVIPGNVGMILRYRGTDLEETTMQVFFEVCPPEWIRSYLKKSRTVVLRNNSIIYFRHLHDASSSAKTRRLGANLGWFAIDQQEECEEMHWDAMISRLRLPRATKKFGFGALNPNGHDWNFTKFFSTFRPWPKDEEGHAQPVNGQFYQSCRREDYLGVAVNSEENRISNGGFIEDAYFDSLKDSYSEDMLDRYLYCSFSEFKGKIYKEYEAGLRDPEYATVHNIEPFDIPQNWQCLIPIDVGGDSPWAVVPMYVDEQGNLIITPGFHRRTGRINEVTSWIKSNLPWDSSRTVPIIDPENAPVVTEFSENGIHCRLAQKNVMAGILRTVGYMHVKKERRLPDWYKATQSVTQYAKFEFKGSPRLFIFNTAKDTREALDVYKWDPKKPDTPYKTSLLRFDPCDAVRYGVMERPEPSQLVETDKYFEISKVDPLTAKTWRALDRKIHERNYEYKGGGGLREVDMETAPVGVQNGRFDWGTKGEM